MQSLGRIRSGYFANFLGIRSGLGIKNIFENEIGKDPSFNFQKKNIYLMSFLRL